MSSRRIPDPGSLIAGITFAGVGLIFLVGRVDLADRARWVWPIVLVGLGAGLIAAVLRRGATPAAATVVEDDGERGPGARPGPAEEAVAEDAVAEEGVAEPGRAQDGAAELSGPEEPAGDLPRRHEP